MDIPTQFSLKNNLSELEKLTEQVGDFGIRHALSEKIIFELNLILDETFTNITSYGYDDDIPHEIDIQMVYSERAITVQVRDDGKPFNPFDCKTPDITGPPECRNIGGLGVYIARELTDEMAYRRENGLNKLTMRKDLP